MRFTFLVHPLSEWTLRVYGVRNLAGDIVKAPLGQMDKLAWRQDLIGSITEFPRLRSKTGVVCSGRVVGIPTMPEIMLAEQSKTVDMMQCAIEQLADGSDLIGLGALCAIVGLRGQELARRIDTPVTTGNALTCWTACETTGRLFEIMRQSPRFRRRILIMGLPGTIAKAITETLARRGLPVEVFHTSYPKTLVRFLDRLEADTGQPIKRWSVLEDALREKGIVVGAGSIGKELADVDLRPGTAVVDVAQPLDTTPAQRAREDLLVVEGELIALPRATGAGWMSFWSSLYNLIVGQDDRHVFACLAEPMVLCMEQTAVSFSLGRRLSAAQVEEIGAMATRHGFGVDDIIHERTPISPEDLLSFARVPWLP